MERVAQLLFGPFHLDPKKKQLWRGDNLLELRPMSVSVLKVLVEHIGEVITKEQLLKIVWAGTYVSAITLKVCISEIRAALGDERAAPRYIETVGREGYRFIDVHNQGREPLLLVDEGDRAQYLVGRQREVAQLGEWFGKARRGARQVIFVAGEAGIGKTTLVDLFLARTQSTHRIRIGRGQCLEQYGEGEAYLPIFEALSRLCREPAMGNLLPLLSQYAPTWLVQMPAVLSNVELASLQQRAQGATRPRMLREMAEMLNAIAVETPFIFVLEDLHWSDYSTLELISYLAQRTERARLMVIGTYRPTDLEQTHPLKKIKYELQVRQQCHEIALKPLSKQEVTTYIANRFPAHEVSADLATVIYRRTEGHALFMVNLVNELANQGGILEKNGKWEIQKGTADVSIPESLREVIEYKFIHLSAEERRVLEAASVEGGEYTAVAIGAAIEKEPLEVEEHCANLVRRNQFIEDRETRQWPDGTVTARYGFVHSLYQQVLYNRLTPGKRVQFHLRIGECLEHVAGERTREIAAELALHFEQGRDFRRAVKYYQQAAETAMQRFAYHEGIGHLTKAIRLLNYLPAGPEHIQQELGLQISLGVALMTIKGYAAPDAKKAYDRARELCKQMGDTPQLVPVLRGLAAFYYVRAELRTAHEIGGQILRLAQEQGDDALLLEAHQELGGTLSSLGEFASALSHLEDGMRLYDSEVYRTHATLYGQDPGVACLCRAAQILWLLGYQDQAMVRNREAVSLAERLTHPYRLAYALNSSGLVYQFCRDLQKVERQAEAAIQLATNYEFPIWKIMGETLRGWSLTMQGKSQEGIMLLQQAISSWRAVGAEISLPYFFYLLAEAYGNIGTPQKGVEVLSEALALAVSTEDRWWEAELYRLKGELTLKLGKVSIRSGPSLKPVKTSLKIPTPNLNAKAEECFVRALEVARQQQAKSLELRAAVSLSRLWQQQGKGADARHLLGQTYRWFREGFDTIDLKAAKVLLEELQRDVPLMKSDYSKLTG